jgi:hypothetical protein
MAGNIASCLINPITLKMEVILQFHAVQFSPDKKTSRHPLRGKLTGPQDLFEHERKERNLLSLRLHCILPCRIF